MVGSKVTRYGGCQIKVLLSSFQSLKVRERILGKYLRGLDNFGVQKT